MKKLIVSASIVWLCVVGASNIQVQDVYDVQNDWIWNTNPNGPWSYGNSTDPTDPSLYVVNLNNETWAPDCDVWWAQTYMDWPLIQKSLTYEDAHSFPGEVLMQGMGPDIGYTTDASVVRWTAPEADTMDVNIKLLYRYGILQNEILYNDTVLVDITNADYYDDGSGLLIYEYSTSLAVSAGDTIDVSLQDIASDSNSKIALEMSIIPEPLTISLLSLASLALLRKRR